MNRQETKGIAELRDMLEASLERNDARLSDNMKITGELKTKQVEEIYLAKQEKFHNIVSKIRTEEGLQWEDIQITFLSSEEILVQYGEEHTERRFNQCGFENRRNGKPIKSWTVFFEEVRRTNGTLPYTFDNRRQIEKIAQDLNKKLCALFPDIHEKPIRLFKEDNSYKPTFKIRSNS